MKQPTFPTEGEANQFLHEALEEGRCDGGYVHETIGDYDVEWAVFASKGSKEVELVVT